MDFELKGLITFSTLRKLVLEGRSSFDNEYDLETFMLSDGYNPIIEFDLIVEELKEFYLKQLDQSIIDLILLKNKKEFADYIKDLEIIDKEIKTKNINNPKLVFKFLHYLYDKNKK